MGFPIGLVLIEVADAAHDVAHPVERRARLRLRIVASFWLSGIELGARKGKSAFFWPISVGSPLRSESSRFQ